MAREARSRLGPSERFAFACLDAQAIPFPADQFDLVIANHMLYHVPSVDDALREISRVLCPHGTLYATKNGASHLKEMAEYVSAASTDTEDQDANVFRESVKNFSLESGEAMLARYFKEVSLRRNEDSLRVTDPEAIVDFVRSSSVFHLPQEGLTRLKEVLDEEMKERGSITITKDPGMFIAANPHAI